MISISGRKAEHGARDERALCAHGTKTRLLASILAHGLRVSRPGASAHPKSVCVSPDVIEAKGYTEMIDENSREVMKDSRRGGSWVLIIAELHYGEANETAVDWCNRQIGQPQACRIPQLVVPRYLAWFGPEALTARLQALGNKLCEDIRREMSTNGSSEPEPENSENAVDDADEVPWDELSDLASDLSLDEGKKRSRSVRSTGGSSNPREHKTRNQVAGDNDTLYREIANVRQQEHREETEPPETDIKLTGA
eukprot:COSAG03_NODE_4725_length_1455_cov_1.811947_3_plen_253_part_00